MVLLRRVVFPAHSLLGLAVMCTVAFRPGCLGAQERPADPPPNVTWWHGLVALGGYAILTTLDGRINRFVAENRSDGSNDFSSVIRRMGQPEVFATAGLGILATGVMAGNPRLRDAGIRITGGLALTGVLVTAAKFTAGRSRPSKAGSDSDDFAPFSGATSAPSGHAAMAFALATSLSDEIRKPWATAVLYTAASGTAWSRVNDNVHWFSDVVAGAALGIVTAKFMDGRLRLFGLNAPRVTPMAQGLSLAWSGGF
jgi:membrane-associated phospholipid phosphatase